jgi:hypothetical protein
MLKRIIPLNIFHDKDAGFAVASGGREMPIFFSI